MANSEIIAIWLFWCWNGLPLLQEWNSWELLFVCLASSLAYFICPNLVEINKLVTLSQFLKFGRGWFTDPKIWAPLVQSSGYTQLYLQRCTTGNLATIPRQGGSSNFWQQGSHVSRGYPPMPRHHDSEETPSIELKPTCCWCLLTGPRCIFRGHSEPSTLSASWQPFSDVKVVWWRDPRCFPSLS